MNLQKKQFNWRNLSQSLIRRKYLIIGIIVLCLTVGFLYAMLAAEKYVSFSTIMITDTDLLSSSQLRFVPNYPHEELEMFRRRITSHDFLNKLLDSLYLTQNPKLAAQVRISCQEHPDVNPTIIAEQVYHEYLKKNISARLVSYNMIEIKASGPTAHEAYRTARALTNLAINESKENQVKTVSTANSFSQQQMEIYKKKLAEAEDRLFQFNRGMVDATLENNELSAEKSQELEAIMLSNDIELQTKQAQYQERSGALNLLTPDQRKELDRRQTDLKRKLFGRIQDLNQLLKKFNWRDIEIIQLNEQIAALKNEYKDRLLTFFTPIYSGEWASRLEDAIKAEYLSLEIALIRENQLSLSSIINHHNRNLLAKPSQNALKERLEREVRSNRDMYDLFAQLARGAEIRESVQLTEAQFRYKVITPPVQPLERIQPARRRIMMIALFMGLVLAIGAVLGLEALNTSIRCVEDVPKFLGVPVLATIPRIEPRHKKHSSWRRNAG